MGQTLREMNVVSCSKCNRLFESFSGRQICPTCSIEEDRKFALVRKFIRAHKGAGVFEVSEACEVTTAAIINWVKEERLSFAEESNVVVECEECGTKIRMGRYCKTCKTKMIKNFQSVYKELKSAKVEAREKRSGVGMHFLNRR